MILRLQLSWHCTTLHSTGAAHVRVKAVSVIHHPACLSLPPALPGAAVGLAGRALQVAEPGWQGIGRWACWGPPLTPVPAHTGPQTGGEAVSSAGTEGKVKGGDNAVFSRLEDNPRYG